MARDPRDETTKIIQRDRYGNAYSAKLPDQALEARRTDIEALILAVESATEYLEQGNHSLHAAARLRLAVKAYRARNTDR
jgi:hypothetical protein